MATGGVLMNTQRKRVALLIESSRGYGRGLLRGIAEYARICDQWSVLFVERGSTESVPAWLKQWSGDGIIARVEDSRMADAIAALDVAAIDLRGLIDVPFPLIETNDFHVTDLAFEHLAERQLPHFAFCGYEQANFSDRRLRYFQPLVESHGYPCHVHLSSYRRTRSSQRIEQQAMLYDDQLVEWLVSLPKPIGMMACNDACGHMVLNACRDAGIAVPDEIAVVGVDNDELYCELTDPPLSSVEPDTEKIGYQAAAMLDGMMDGEKVETAKTFVSPRGLVARQSTAVFSVDDPHVRAALRLIHEQASTGIDVNAIVRQLPISRRTFERRFRKLVGRSPNSEIARVRIERLKRLLKETDLPLQRVSEIAGFAHVEHMHLFFKKHTGTTPGSYRQDQQTGER